MVVPSSTMIPSTWKNSEPCEASIASYRKQRPGSSARIGGCMVRMTCSWPGDVWVRRRWPGMSTYSVSHRSRAGWSGGMLRSWKLVRSSSISGLSWTTNPNWPKIRAISDMDSMLGWSEPCRNGRPGIVTSIVSAARRASSSADPRTARRAAIAASISARTRFATAPTFGRSSTGSAPMPRSTPVRRPFLPRTSSSSASIDGDVGRGGERRRGLLRERLEIARQLVEVHRRKGMPRRHGRRAGRSFRTGSIGVSAR